MSEGLPFGRFTPRDAVASLPAAPRRSRVLDSQPVRGRPAPTPVDVEPRRIEVTVRHVIERGVQAEARVPAPPPHLAQEAAETLAPTQTPAPGFAEAWGAPLIGALILLAVAALTYAQVHVEHGPVVSGIAGALAALAVYLPFEIWSRVTTTKARQ